MGVKERIGEYISHNNMPISEFEKICGLSNGYISSMRKGFGTGKLDNVLKAFPNLDRNWLLYGEGEMLKSNTEAPQSNDGSVTLPADVWELIKTQAESIKMKDEQINDVLASLKSKDKQVEEVIELLKEQLKKGRDVENSFRVANLVVVEDE